MSSHLCVTSSISVFLTGQQDTQTNQLMQCKCFCSQMIAPWVQEGHIYPIICYIFLTSVVWGKIWQFDGSHHCKSLNAPDSVNISKGELHCLSLVALTGHLSRNDQLFSSWLLVSLSILRWRERLFCLIDERLCRKGFFWCFEILMLSCCFKVCFGRISFYLAENEVGI